ncbi:choice-of-anchor Q domain-containing protein [Paraflavitalea speifideaquila]|uniref:choice-of-anchor Q domain-containing protein n=1 Tax=Paraflavitalea speifideaquila TaxID=3076558 RepID=UPI0028EE149F|nr:choice-of-anchor Q domain-containing protein [Paraflavitalea speifideiaquila]
MYNFRLKEESPALNKGKATTLTIDLDGNPRPVGLPDLGCYEKNNIIHHLLWLNNRYP